MDDQSVSEEIVEVIDVLEQIKEVNKMIDIHLDDPDDLMINQYRHKKEKLLTEFRVLLTKFNIQPTDLAA